MKNPLDILNHYWGYTQFRPQQKEVIDAVLAGKDVLTLLPTGAGKSLCFQLPTLAQEGVCVIISPLIALMQDQVKDLLDKNISAVNLGGQLSQDAESLILEDALKGKYKFIYCSPEKLAQSHFQTFLSNLTIQLFAIDEAHCISQWGYDFRPSYRKLSILKKLFPKVPILAMTASAIPMVQEDIIKQLSLQQAIVIRDSFLRPNIKYSIRQVPVKLHTCRQLLNEISGSVIIYCNTRNNVSQLTQLLKAYQFKVAEYHAGLSIETRQRNQQAWMKDDIQIMVSTSAFGMGINKGGVRAVIHYDIPGSLEQYYQEAGRSGRDGLPASAILLFQQNDWEYWQLVQEKKYPSIATIKKVYQDLADYVQLPIGMGEKQQFLFDFDSFYLRFEWDKMTARNALQWIEQEGHVKFSASSFKPSMVQVIADRQMLEDFEKENTILSIVLQNILRTYGGVLDSPQYINEQLLAELLQRDVTFVQNSLVSLQNKGMIQFEQKENQPVVQFLWNRASAAYIKIDLDNYQLRQKAFLERVRQFSDYIWGKNEPCRSTFLAKYFGEINPIPCKICDLCSSTKK
ncbi:MAG: RecQ family ATP-dependent DNA helicase [Bacteroidetes bacterium]|nr:RecQ family ATP-dependent DNA helicase [Bacteroidota bacterium]